MKLLLRPNILAYIVSPLISALIFYALVVFRLKAGDYLPGIRIYALVLAIPMSYFGVLVFTPSLLILRNLGIYSYYSLALTGFINGALTVIVVTGIIILMQKANPKEVYGDMLEPILAAGIAGLIGILFFKLISDWK